MSVPRTGTFSNMKRNMHNFMFSHFFFTFDLIVNFLQGSVSTSVVLLYWIIFNTVIVIQGVIF